MNSRFLTLATLLAIFTATQAAEPRSFPSVDELPEVKDLPNPFVFLDGTAVKDREDWARRREEMKAMVLHYQFGHAPPLPAPNMIKAVVVSETDALEGIAVRREVKLQFGPHQELSLALGIHTPKNGQGPFPVIVHNSPGIFEVEDSIVADLVRRGYMLVSYRRTDLHPDWGKDPVAKKKKDKGDARRAYPDSDWRCLRVWAWGGSVVVNWLSTLPEVDMQKLVCTGHSRGGQTAALMGMIDERIAVVAPNAGGSITTGCHRIGRTRSIKSKMNSGNAYWYSPNLIPFGDRETRLPFDLHFIKAAVAPRAWFNSNGLADGLNPEGGMVTWRAARVVYDWMSVKEKCAQWYREGGHDQGEQDWKTLADFADFIFFQEPLPDPKAFYQEPWPEMPQLFSWKAPRRRY
ncbi:MAG: alpha/beta hydrolase family protein [Limisphaerales bacterium]